MGGLMEQADGHATAEGSLQEAELKETFIKEKVYTWRRIAVLLFSKIWKEMYFQRHHLFSLKCSVCPIYITRRVIQYITKRILIEKVSVRKGLISSSLATHRPN